jgi:RNA polymerase sigma-E/F/G factor
MNPTEDRLISLNLGLVVQMDKNHRESVRKLCGARIGLADLIAAGKIGLAEAAKRFNPAKGKFSTYAGFWITKYLFKARHQMNSVHAVKLDNPFKDGLTYHDVVSDKKARSASELLIAQEKRDRMEACKSLIAGTGLDNREREIIFQRYGLDDGELKTQKQIAKKLGLTRVRVTQLEKIALGKIAKHLGN